MQLCVRYSEVSGNRLGSTFVVLEPVLSRCNELLTTSGDACGTSTCASALLDNSTKHGEAREK